MDAFLDKVKLYCSFDTALPQAGMLPAVGALAINQITGTALQVVGAPAAALDSTTKYKGGAALAADFAAYTRLIEPTANVFSLNTANPKLTVELWVYRKSASAAFIMGKSGKANVSYTNWQLVVHNTGVVMAGFGITGTPGSFITNVNTAAGVVPVGQWVHLALVVDGTAVKIYANGAQVLATTLAQMPQDNNPLPFYIGPEFDQPSQPCSGCLIDELRITTDVRYTSPFTPEDYSGEYPALPAGGYDAKTVSITAIPANQQTRAQFQPQDVDWRGGPGFVYPGPMPAPPARGKPLCLGQDHAWVRDGVQNVLQGYIESTVTISGEGVARRVLCFDQAGNLIAETMSRASDGKYRFDLLWLNRRYMLVAQDDPAFGPADYNAVAADYQQPTPYAPGQGVGLV